MAIYSTLKRKVQTGAKRIRSCFRKKTLKTTKAAEKEEPTAELSLGQNDLGLSICSDSSSLWNVTPMSFRDVFDLSLESNQDVWTVDTMALDAILRDINGEEEDPDCPPRLRFRRCTSPELKSRGISTSTPTKTSSVKRTEECSIEDTPRLCRKRNTVHLPPAQIIVVKEADVDSRVDLTDVEPRPSPPLARPKHSRRRQLGGQLHLAKLPSISDTRTLQWSSNRPGMDSLYDSWSAPSILATYHAGDEH